MHHEYDQVVENTWMKDIQNLVNCLACDDSIAFNKDIFGSIHRRKQNLKSHIKGIHKAQERVDSARLVYLEHRLQKDYDTISYRGK